MIHQIAHNLAQDLGKDKNSDIERNILTKWIDVMHNFETHAIATTNFVLSEENIPFYSVRPSGRLIPFLEGRDKAFTTAFDDFLKADVKVDQRTSSDSIF